METVKEDLNRLVGERIADLRASGGYSLQELSEASGVSRSMISLIERGEASATAVVLNRLAEALGTSLYALFESQPVSGGSQVVRSRERDVWTDPETGYVRRLISPPGLLNTSRVSEIRFPAGQSVAFDYAAESSPLFQHIWITKGQMEITVGAERYELRRGDCLARVFDEPATFRNPGSVEARYVVFLSREPTVR